jgi:hypothetical protein
LQERWGIFLGGLTLAAVLMPQERQFWLSLSASEVQIQLPAAIGSGTNPTTLDLRIVTVLGKDSILAILAPSLMILLAL